VIYFSIIIILIYLIFILWLSSSFKNYRNKLSSTKPKVSVIIAARNEESKIVKLLNCLLNQKYPKEKIEFILIDDHSDDNTEKIIKNFIKKDNRIFLLKSKKIPNKISPKKWALKQGVNKSKGEILLFTDADCIFGPKWVNQMTSFFDDSKIGMVLGPSPLGISNNFWSKTIYIDSIGLDSIMAASALRNIPLTASGRNMAIRKKVFDLINGYDSINKFISGDDDLVMHLIQNKGYKILPCCNQEGIVMSPAPSSFYSFIKQRLRFASKGKSYYGLNFIKMDFKLSLLLIYITNFLVLISQFNYLISLKIIWLIPFLLKVLVDLFFLRSYSKLLKIKFANFIYLFNALWHPSYIVFFGLFGPFIKIDWKGRKTKPIA
tara:strand:+ start:360 stop:1490 length:1131 start_codon:yes stop_codon:yes gene_type:complete